jgi:hypothetical protein
MSMADTSAKPTWTWLGWVRRLVRWAVMFLEAYAEAKGEAEAPEGSRPDREPHPGLQDDLFLPAARLIYRYYTGTREGKPQIRAVDPLPLYKRIMDKGPSIAINLKSSDSASKYALPAHQELIRDLQSIFEVPPYEEGGLTEGELRALLDHFLTFVNGLKKNGPTPATSQGATGSGTRPTAPEEAPQQDPRATPASSGSGSTASASSSDESSPSPKG